MAQFIRKTTQFDDFIPDVEKWTFSMLEFGVQKGVISPKSLEQVQVDTMKLLRDQIPKFTKGKSASVKTDVGIDLYNGIIYTIDTFFRSFSRTEDAFEALMTFNVTKFHAYGQELLKRKFEQLKLSYQYLKSMHLEMPIDAYTDTIHDGLKLFFDTYDYEFMPNINTATIDYPLFYDPMKEFGIWYCDYYIKNLNLENDFCSYFDIHDSISVITSYARNYDMTSNDLINNIFEILIKQSVASIILGRSSKSLFLTNDDMKMLSRKFMTHNDPERLFEEAYYSIVDFVMPHAKFYFKGGLPPILTQFRTALASGHLSHFFTITDI